jgi:1-phosphofructokinase family hexose kinase
LSDHKQHYGADADRPAAMLIASPNLTIDRTATIDELRPGEVVRFDGVVARAGGKGVNVARVARALGAHAEIVGFTPGRTGAAAAALIADEGLELHAVPTGGELRSTTVVLERSGRVTVMNEPGPPIEADDWRRYEATVAGALRAQRVLVCSGSVPPVTPPDAYARLTALAARAGARAIVDVGGPVLGAALAERPALVCPNLGEAEGLLRGRADEPVEAGEPSEARARAVEAAAELVSRGARAAAVTAGAAGAALADGTAVSWHAAPTVCVRNPIGAGDALVGGVAVALERGEALADAVVTGVAAAAASVETSRAGEIEPARAAELRAAAAPPERVGLRGGES